MGMSHDFEVAIREGATIVRIGSLFFEGSADFSSKQHCRQSPAKLSYNSRNRPPAESPLPAYFSAVTKLCPVGCPQMKPLPKRSSTIWC